MKSTYYFCLFIDECFSGVHLTLILNSDMVYAHGGDSIIGGFMLLSAEASVNR